MKIGKKAAAGLAIHFFPGDSFAVSIAVNTAVMMTTTSPRIFPICPTVICLALLVWVLRCNGKGPKAGQVWLCLANGMLHSGALRSPAFGEMSDSLS